MRKFKIWYYGKMPLAKKIRKKIIIGLLLERFNGMVHPTTINPYTFQQLSNKGQLEYWKHLNKGIE